MADISAQLKQVVELRGTLDREQAGDLMRLLLSGEVSDVQVGALLAAMATRGETAAEIAGFVDTMRAAAVDIPLTEEERATLVDTCGTGGNARGTFNISTAVALVAAAAGFPSGMRIAKHGNRGVTSKCGSADVLKEMGVPVELSPAQAVQCLRQTGFLFLYAPALHPAMRAVQHVRKALGIRTIFNILGPLTNPAGARAQVLGVYSAHLVPLVAEALAMLGVRHAMVVHGHNDLGIRDQGTGNREQGAGSGGQRAEVQATAGQQVPGCLDELTLTGPSEVAEVHGHTVALRRITPEDVGLQRAPFAALAGGDAATNAAILESIFAGEQGPRRDVVLFNAAAALVVGGAAEDLVAGIRLAADAIDSGAVTALVERLREFAKEH